jgi:hypothetical protein
LILPFFLSQTPKTVEPNSKQINTIFQPLKKMIAGCLKGQVSKKDPSTKPAKRVKLSVVKKIQRLKQLKQGDPKHKYAQRLCLSAKQTRKALMHRMLLYLEKIELTLAHAKKAGKAKRIYTKKRSRRFHMRAIVRFNKRVAFCWHAKKLSNAAQIRFDAIRSIEALAPYCQSQRAPIF